MATRALTEGGIGKRAAQTLERFLALEASGGIILIFTALAAILCANTELRGLYEHLLHAKITLALGGWEFARSLHFWVNDGLMAIFFLLVGMEIKREMKEGHLASRQQSLLPFAAAAGGMLVPGLIYWHLNAGLPTLRGWAIPTATDIAFALGILALFGSRIPLGLKVFLTAVAVIDDLGAVVIIAAFYTADLSVSSLVTVAGLLVILGWMNQRGTGKLWLYLGVGVALWMAVLQSGIHATIAGVLLGFLIPLKDAQGHSPLRRLEHHLLPWTTYAILPLFAFFNAGVDFRAISLAQLADPVPLGIAFGLFFGKQLGVFSSTALLIKAGFCRLPQLASWSEFYGVCLLCGIGFTMSLFISGLAFQDPLIVVETRLGVLLGTVSSALIGYGYLRVILSKQSTERRTAIEQDWANHKQGL